MEKHSFLTKQFCMEQANQSVSKSKRIAHAPKKAQFAKTKQAW